MTLIPDGVPAASDHEGPEAGSTPEPPGTPPEVEGAGAALRGEDPSLDLEDGPPRGPTVSFSFNLGRIPDQGEDADPILRNGRDLGLVGVFDGMGGAGGTVYDTPDGKRTGAYLAARIARDVVESRMVELLDPDWNLDGPAAAEDLRRSVHDALVARLEQLHAPTSGLRSRLLRALPTTMALLALQRLEPAGRHWACHVLWAGDSRAYVFEPDRGARQLTIDDIRDRGDAMANLRQDSVVSNAMSADTDFVVHHRQVDLTAPFLVTAATDGCFGYVRSPMHFEDLVLRNLRDSPDTASWSARIQAEVSAVTGDDAAMATLGIGSDHQGFRRLFSDRATTVHRSFLAPLEAAAADVERLESDLDIKRREYAETAASLWAAYKPDYEQYAESDPTRVEEPK